MNVVLTALTVVSLIAAAGFLPRPRQDGLVGSCFWHAPAVVTGTNAMSCARTSGASAVHEIQAYNRCRRGRDFSLNVSAKSEIWPHRARRSQTIPLPNAEQRLLRRCEQSLTCRE